MSTLPLSDTAEPFGEEAFDGYPRPAPERPVYVVGDLHGRVDLIDPILKNIDLHIGEHEASAPVLVFVGDFIDFGPDAAGTLSRLRDLAAEFPDNVVCLMGNHERMMLDFLSDPELRGARWLRAGGRSTLQSYGVPLPERSADGSTEAFAAAAAQLRRAMPEGMEAWLAGLPLSWRSGNLWVVHAAADPQFSMAKQSARVLLWGHPEFDSVTRRDGVWVVHGHTETSSAYAVAGRINVDTGAWHSAVLSAAAVQPDGRITFITSQTEPRG